MPKSGGAAKVEPSPADIQQAQTLKMLRETVMKPIIGATIGPATSALGGAFETNLTAPEREAIEGQFGQARENIIGQSGARGGMLQKQLIGLDTARAKDVSSAINQARQRGTERALTLLPSAYPGANTTIGAQGDLANRMNEINAFNTKVQTQANQNLFSGVGGLLGKFFGGKK